MEFRILGPLEVLDGDRAVPLPRGRGRALLALLILHAGEVVATERLVDELWGDAPPSTVRTALQGLVSSLRKRLEPARTAGRAPALLRTEPFGYVLAADPPAIDAHRFRRLLDEARHAPTEGKAARLREALALWRGPALADFTYEPFAQQEIAALEELRLTAVEERIEADLALGRHGQIIAEAEVLVAEHPFRERLYGQLMLALYRAGRQAEALETYRAARRTLVEELGIDPGPELRQLEQAILGQDPALDLSPDVDPISRSSVGPRDAETAEQSWLPRERKLVTVVSVSTALAPDVADRLDPEALERTVRQARSTVAGMISKHGGTVQQTAGDEIVGMFGVPIAHEDDPLRAARAAVDVHTALTATAAEGGVPPSVRIGIEAGEMVVGGSGSEDSAASGAAVLTATRLQRVAADGELLVGGMARRLLRDAATLAPVVQPETDSPGTSLTWRLVELLPTAPAVARRWDAALVARTAELARLHDAFQRAVQDGACHRLTVVGEPGIGKSRLARELAAAAAGAGARTLTGHCPPYGEGITFWPLREVVHQAAGPDGRAALVGLLGHVDDGEWIAGQVAAAVGLTGEPGRPDELFPAVRRLFEALAVHGPVVVTLDDLHWAEPTLLDLVEYLTGRTRGPVLLLCLARPDLLERRPSWADASGTADALVLEALGQDDTEQLVADRLEGRTVPSETLAEVVASAQGNPLFVEQMVAAFEDEGAVSVPASVHALLAARLDRLGPGERDLLRCAAVVGNDVPAEALAALVPGSARPFVRRHLGALERKQLIRLHGDDATFGHALIRLAAYRSTTRADRARLHERFAEWLGHEAQQPPPELDELIGYHLEQAVTQHRELEIADTHTTELATRAGEHLAAAAARAFGGVRDMAAAANLASRARALLPAVHPRRNEAADILTDAYPPLGRHAEADAVLTELLAEARTAGDRSSELIIRLKRARIRLDTQATDVEEIRSQADQAMTEFDATGDDGGAAQAAYLLAQVHRMIGATGQVAAVARRGLPHADRSGLVRAEAGLRYALSWAMQAGETPAADAVDTCSELAWRRGVLHPPVNCDVAVLRAMRGETGAARDLVAGAREHMVERLRVRRPLMFVARYAAEVEILSASLDAAERELRTALTMALDMGEHDHLGQIAAELSHVLAVLGDVEDADRMATLGTEHAHPASVAQTLWRKARARVLVSLDRPDDAERFAREAVRHAPTEMPNLRAGSLVELAETLLAQGRPDAAAPVVGEAIDLYQRKGNLVSAAQAHSLRRP